MLIPRHALDLQTFTSADETRAILTNIAVTPRYAEATDGHQLVRVSLDSTAAADFPVVNGKPARELEDDPNNRLLIPSAVAKSLLKQLPKRHKLWPVATMAAVVDADTGPGIAVTDLDHVNVIMEATTERRAGKYPLTQQVMPRTVDPESRTAGVNVTYLKNLCAYIERTAGKDSTMVLTVQGATKPILFQSRTEGGPVVDAVIMPMRIAHAKTGTVTMPYNLQGFGEDTGAPMNPPVLKVIEGGNAG